MTTSTDLNVSPYFDDFDESKNFHRILFQPKQAVQARELTQLQTILQNQIERFGDAVYQNGTVIKGCTFKYDTAYAYVKLRDIRVDLGDNDVSSLVGMTVTNPVTGLQALIVNYQEGFETQNPNTKTIFVKYMNTGSNQEKTFAANDTLNFTDASGAPQPSLTVNVLPATLFGNPTNPIGVGYAFSVTDGIIYQNGFFIHVNDGTSVIVTPYTNLPDQLVVGFTTVESIINVNSDPSLYDNSAGFDNYNAPGADRLKLTPTLVVYPTSSAPTSNFFVLAEWQAGEVVRENSDTEYSVIGQEFARRTSEESGDYVVHPFVLTTSNITGNTSYLNVQSTQGLAYVQGFRVEKLNSLATPVRKGTDTAQLVGQQIVPNFGNYVLVNNMAGYFESNKIPTVSLRDTAANTVGNSTFTTIATGNQIGTAKLLSVAFTNNANTGSANAQYKMYLSDIQMANGQSFASVRSLQLNSGAGGLADIVLTANGVQTSNGVAQLQESTFATMVYPFAQGAVKTLRIGSNNNTSYIFRTANTGQSFSTSGTTGIITLSGGQQYPYGSGLLNDTQKASIIVVPTSTANVSLTKAGTVTVNTASNTVTGSSTNFTSEYQIGDFIQPVGAPAPRQITSITNTTFMSVATSFSGNVSAVAHSKVYPANIPIPFVGRNSTINLANTTAMSLTLFAANGSQETLSASTTAVITYDVQKTSAVQLNKSVLKNQYIKIDCSTNPGGTTGPWCLGLPDVYQIVGIYKDVAYNESSSTDVSSNFSLDNGQKDSIYGLSYLKKVPGSPLTINTSDKILVKVNVFQASGSGYGFFSVDSYPIDDANTANTTAIQTAVIPTFTSPKSGTIYNLRDCADFRPVVANTAVFSSNAASASINPANTNVFTGVETYVVSPNQPFSTSLSYYLGRVDKLAIDTYGNFGIIEGTPAVTPVAPPDISGSMTIAQISVAPYPSLSMSDAASFNRPQMALSIASNQITRLTMGDMTNLQKRVTNLEYYTSLNTLETATTALSVKDPNGLDRFKNGIFVDGFDDMSRCNASDIEFTATIDSTNSILRAGTIQRMFDMKLGTTFNAYSATGEMASLPYVSANLIAQPLASRDRTLSGTLEAWNVTPPTTQAYPPYDPSYDHMYAPYGFVDVGTILYGTANYNSTWIVDNLTAWYATAAGKASGDNPWVWATTVAPAEILKPPTPPPGYYVVGP